MRISDWSSDVCSSDLLGHHRCLQRESGTRHRAQCYRDDLGRQDEVGAYGALDLGVLGRRPAGRITQMSRFAAMKKRMNYFFGAFVAEINTAYHQQWGTGNRSEERRVGKERVSTCRSRW